MTIDDRKKAPGRVARRLIRTVRQATLATLDAETGGGPYASLTLVACGHDAAPLLLLSDMARHSRNIAADGRVSLLFAKSTRDAIAQGRVSVMGRAELCDDPLLKQRFLARHTSAQTFVEFTDFRLYRLEVDSVHFVAGFGSIHTLDRAEVIFDTAASGELAAAEPDIIAHMNADHSQSVNLYAHNLVGRPGMDWRLTGVDPEGIDLGRNDADARLDFGDVIHGAEEARAALVKLAHTARGEA
ncbi:MAG: putative heme iron utilization protein [Alphaproteobacteria bacterium]|jgi:putative heme iron utilization protein